MQLRILGRDSQRFGPHRQRGIRFTQTQSGAGDLLHGAAAARRFLQQKVGNHDTVLRPCPVRPVQGLQQFALQLRHGVFFDAADKGMNRGRSPAACRCGRGSRGDQVAVRGVFQIRNRSNQSAGYIMRGAGELLFAHVRSGSHHTADCADHIQGHAAAAHHRRVLATPDHLPGADAGHAQARAQTDLGVHAPKPAAALGHLATEQRVAAATFCHGTQVLRLVTRFDRQCIDFLQRNQGNTAGCQVRVQGFAHIVSRAEFGLDQGQRQHTQTQRRLSTEISSRFKSHHVANSVTAARLVHIACHVAGGAARQQRQGQHRQQKQGEGALHGGLISSIGRVAARLPFAPAIAIPKCAVSAIKIGRLSLFIWLMLPKLVKLLPRHHYDKP